MVHAGNLRRISREPGGQSLLEVALMLPFLVLLIGYAVDFGYFFLVAANLTSAARNATEYSIQGFESPGGGRLPAAGPLTSTASVAAAAVGDMSSLLNSSATTSVEVCSQASGSSGNLPICSAYGPADTTYAVDTDPEAPHFMLQRVDVTYTVQPPVAMNLFGIPLLGSLKFHRQVFDASDGMTDNSLGSSPIRRVMARIGTDQTGSVAIETTLAYMILITFILAIIEFSLMGYTYSVFAEATRQGVRYATFHGSSSATCSGPSTGCADPSGSNVATQVTQYATSFAGNVGGVSISVTYPDGSSAPSSRVAITVLYTYVPMFNLPGFTQNFQVSSQGRIIY